MFRIAKRITPQFIEKLKHPFVLHSGVFFLLYFPLLIYSLSIVIDIWKSDTSIGSYFDPTTFQLFFNSVQLGLWTALFSIIFGGVCYFTYHCLSPSLKYIVLGLSFIPLAFPPFAVATAWTTLGSLPMAFEGERLLLGGGYGLSWMYSLPGVGLLLAFCYWPIVFLILVMYARPTDNEYDSSLIFLSKWQTLKLVIIPGIRFPVFVGATLVFGLGFSQFEVPSLFQINVFALEIYVRFSALLDEQAGILLCLIFIPLSLILSGLLGQMHKHLNYNKQFSHPANLNLFHYMLISSSAILLVISILLPMTSLLVHSLTGDFAENVQGLWRSSQNSIINSLAASIVLILLGLCLSANISKFSHKISLILLFFLFFIPGIMIGSALLHIRSYWPGRLSFFAQWLSLQWGLIIQYGVLSLLIGTILWSILGRSAREASWIKFHSSWQRIRYVYLPAMLPSTIIAVILTMLFLWHNIAITVLLHPPGGETLAMRYFNLLHYGSEPRTATVGLALIMWPLLFYMGLTGIVVFLKQRKG